MIPNNVRTLTRSPRSRNSRKRHRDWHPKCSLYPTTGKLATKGMAARPVKALITGGDSGIGRAVAIAYAREGADVAINYLPEEEKTPRRSST